jgi:hypothetical protein
VKVQDTAAPYAAGNALDASPAPIAPARAATSFVRRLFRLLASYQFSCVILFFLFVLTLLGTLYQVDNGVYAAQRKYFESLALLQDFGPISLPLPGGRLLLALLFVNLLCGAVLRARKGWSRIGILTAHVGILMLLAGAFITYQFAQSGRMVLYEGQESGYFESTDEWELVVTPLEATGKVRQFIVRQYQLWKALGDRSVCIPANALPFSFDVNAYYTNALPRPAADTEAERQKAIDGYVLRYAKPAGAEKDLPGANIVLHDRKSGAILQRGIVWGGESAPWTVKTPYGTYSFELRRRQTPLPFTLALDKFSRELHPRTTMAKAYASEVTKIEDGMRQSLRISMNEPLRSHGYTVYQASWGPQDAAPGTPVYSVLAVSRDPAERFPLFACVVITCGMALHFALRLLRHLRDQGARTA